LIFNLYKFYTVIKELIKQIATVFKIMQLFLDFFLIFMEVNPNNMFDID